MTLVFRPNRSAALPQLPLTFEALARLHYTLPTQPQLRPSVAPSFRPVPSVAPVRSASPTPGSTPSPASEVKNALSIAAAASTLSGSAGAVTAIAAPVAAVVASLPVLERIGEAIFGSGGGSFSWRRVVDEAKARGAWPTGG
jgi:hypothetical protein